jgi:hypothetical protein
MEIDCVSEDIRIEADRRDRYQSISPRPTAKKPTKHVQYQDDYHQPNIDTSIYKDVSDDHNRTEEFAVAKEDFMISLPLPTDHERVQIRNIYFSYDAERTRVTGKRVFMYRDYPHPPMCTNGITYHNSD